MKTACAIIVLALALGANAWEPPIGGAGTGYPPHKPYGKPYGPYGPGVGGTTTPGCFYQAQYVCKPKVADATACGEVACGEGQYCMRETDYIEKQVTYEVTACTNPKLACKPIEKPCGPELVCTHDQLCKAEPVCSKVPATYQPYGNPYGPAYFKEVCETVYTCEAKPTEICETKTHHVCVAKDPKAYAPGYYNGYKMDWLPRWRYGQKCGPLVCQPGSSCATCEVEECNAVIMDKTGAQCGFKYSPSKYPIPTYCDPGYKCVEVCEPVTKTVQEPVEVAVCVDPYDESFLADATFQDCGPYKCHPAYECVLDKVEVCPYGPRAPTEVSPEGPSDGATYKYPGYAYPKADCVGGESMEKPYFPHHYYPEPEVSPDTVEEDPWFPVDSYKPYKPYKPFPHYPHHYDEAPVDQVADEVTDNDYGYEPWKPVSDSGAGSYDPWAYEPYEPYKPVEPKKKSVVTATVSSEDKSVYTNVETLNDEAGAATASLTIDKKTTTATSVTNEKQLNNIKADENGAAVGCDQGNTDIACDADATHTVIEDADAQATN